MGRSREVNEDSCCYLELDSGWDLIIVADGMGGHNAGEVASRIAINSIAEYIGSSMAGASDIDAVKIIESAVSGANNDIYMESLKNPDCSGMGTTVTAAMIKGDLLYFGHVGDSRAYILNKGKLNKITNDHSLVAELVRNGTITEDEAMFHPQKNIITRALGTEGNVQVDTGSISIEEGDIIILCTDGLTNMLCDSQIEDILVRNDSTEKAAQELIESANALGGFDNITVAVAKPVCPNKGVRE
jgi:protein phosphatase